MSQQRQLFTFVLMRYQVPHSIWSQIAQAIDDLLGFPQPLQAVAYPGIFFGGGQQIQLGTEGRENGDLGGGSPLVRGFGGSRNLVQEISFHMVKFSYFLVLYAYVTSCLGEKKNTTVGGVIAGGEGFSRNNSKNE